MASAMTARLSRLATVVPAGLGRTSARGERGQALAEMAIALTVLLLLIIAIVKGSITFNNWIILTDAVRTGARSLSVSRGTGGDACATARAAVLKAAITLTNPTPAATAGVSSPSTCTSLNTGDSATVSATYPSDFNLYGVGGPQLSAATTVRIE